MSIKSDRPSHDTKLESILVAALHRRRRRPSRTEAWVMTVLAIIATAFLAFNLYASVGYLLG